MNTKGFGTIAVVAGVAGLLVVGSIVFFNMQPEDEIARHEAESMMEEGKEMVREGEEMQKKAGEMMEDIDPFFLVDEETEPEPEADDESEFPEGKPDLVF